MKTVILQYFKDQLKTEQSALAHCHESQKPFIKDRISELKKHIKHIKKLC